MRPKKTARPTKYKAVLIDLSNRREALQHELQHLLATQRGLQLQAAHQHSTMRLSSDSAAAGATQQQQQQQQPAEGDTPHHGGSDAAAAAAQCSQLLRSEIELLQQLAPGCLAGSSSGACFDVGMDTIAPPDDLMALFKHILSQPPAPEAASMTLHDLAQLLRESMLQVSVQLHVLRGAPDEPCGQAALQKIKQLVGRYIHVSLSLTTAGKDGLLEALNILNLDTMQPDAEGADLSTAQASKLLRALRLTDQQEEVIAIGVKLYLRLLSGIMQERQQLQMEAGGISGCRACNGAACTATPADGDGSTSSMSMAAHDAGVPGSCGPGKQSPHSSQAGSNTGGGAACSSGAALDVHDSLDSKQSRLQKQEHRRARLRLLMRKEFLMRFAGNSFFCGMLSWEQLAAAFVASWPYRVHPPAMAAKVARAHEGRLRQEQQA